MILLTLKALSSYLPVQEVVDLNELSSLKTRKGSPVFPVSMSNWFLKNITM